MYGLPAWFKLVILRKLLPVKLINQYSFKLAFV